MDASTTVAWLSKAVAGAARSAKFCVSGCLPAIDPGIEIDNVGAIRLPMKRKTAKELVAQCRVAPYGKGTKTLVDTKVRNTFELGPGKFRLGEEWAAAIAGAARQAAQQLGLPADRLAAKLYKLLVYERGGFFLPHRDSEKLKGMVASLIVVLPNPFDGGALVVRHGAVKQRLSFEEAAKGKSPCFVAFYADCEHEVERVTGGVRLCLAYNLVLQGKQPRSAVAANPTALADVLAESIGPWIAKQPDEPLVFALEHHYTQQGLSLGLLKGADRRIANLVAAAAEKSDCRVHLAHVTRHLLQFADDGSIGRYERYGRYGGYSAPGPIEIGETYDDELTGTQWTDMDGNKQPLGDIAFEPAAIVSSVPLDDWKPTSEEYEGYTGNEGNTLDRWYHRSAIVVWRNDHHFDVVAGAGASASIPLFCSMTAKLTKTPKKRFDQARRDCLQFARAIIARWPRQSLGYAYAAARDKSPGDDFPERLLALHDRDVIALFLAKLAEQDQLLKLSSFVVAAGREFGVRAFAAELKQLISAPVGERGPQEIPYRDVEWLAALCCDPAEDSGKSALLGELCSLAVERFCVPRSSQPAYYGRSYRREISVDEKSLPLLLKALLTAGNDQDLARVIEFVEGSPDRFSMDDCKVPSLKALIPWTKKRFGSVAPRLLRWLATVREQLESATAARPAPPTDWTRPAETACTCQYCSQLKAFLADPAAETTRVRAAEGMRQHLIEMIDRREYDVRHALERKGSPYSLVLTKTTGSYERALQRFEADRKLLAALPTAD